VRVTLVSLLVGLALIVVPGVGAQSSRVSGRLPTRGIFVPGVSLAGIQLGFTQSKVKAVLG